MPASTPDLRPLPANGILMTIEKFISNCKSRHIMDHDGRGEFATSEGCSFIRAHPERWKEIRAGNRPPWATHVLWIDHRINYMLSALR